MYNFDYIVSKQIIENPLNSKIKKLQSKLTDFNSGYLQNYIMKKKIIKKDQKSFTNNLVLINSHNQNKNLKEDKSLIDCPEDLHYFYVNLLQKNKKLYYKFDNLQDCNPEL